MSKAIALLVLFALTLVALLVVPASAQKSKTSVVKLQCKRAVVFESKVNLKVTRNGKVKKVSYKITNPAGSGRNNDIYITQNNTTRWHKKHAVNNGGWNSEKVSFSINPKRPVHMKTVFDVGVVSDPKCSDTE